MDCTFADGGTGFMLYEDGFPLGYSRPDQKGARNLGKGRCERLNDELVFSVFDNTDPNENGRRDSVRPGLG